MATTVAPDLGLLVAAARAAHERWAARSLDERARVFREVVRALLRHADESADAVVAETQKPRTEAIANELYAAAARARWLSRNLEPLLKDERLRVAQPHLKMKRSWLVHEPLGVVVAITPWNIPF